VAADPEWQAVAEQIGSTPFPPVAETGITHLDSIVCRDGVIRPWVLYIPSTYDSGEPTPLFVYLHGGVSSAAVYDDPVGYASEHSFTAAAEENGWLILFPFGQMGATWWDEVGMANIDSQVRTVKRRYNVDDDRVWLGGFSDGASAAFMFAMVDPSDYGAFIALNGHMGVGSSAGEMPTYAANFAASPVYAVTTDNDGLYPSKKMAPTIEMARRAGADMYYRQYEGVHRPTYLEQDMGLVVNYLGRHPRDPLPTRLSWETALPGFGRCHWFAIDAVGQGVTAPWHQAYNVQMVSDRVSIGFVHDETYEGTGVKVGRVVKLSFAESVALQADDVVIGGNGIRVETMDDLRTFKQGIKRGDAVQLQIRRADQTITLSGRLPEPEVYDLFNLERPSARARVAFAANRVEVETSRVGAFSIFVHPEMIRIEQKLVVEVNGEQVYEALVEPDLDFMLRNYLENRDRSLLFVNRIEIELE
jgi:predicted esterase